MSTRLAIEFLAKTERKLNPWQWRRGESEAGRAYPILTKQSIKSVGKSHLLLYLVAREHVILTFDYRQELHRCSLS